MAVKTYKKGEATQISANFKSTEFDCHGSGCCSSTLIDDKLVNFLQDIRNHFGKPLNVSSAFRCNTHNKSVGGATASRHKTGEAADIYINGIEPKEIAKYAESIGVLGIGLYETDKDGYFVHIDTRSSKSFWYGQAQEKRTTFGGTATVKPDTSKVDTSAIDTKVMWDFFKSQGLTDFGVAGLMGNLYAESAFYPCNLENAYERSLGMNNAEYTLAVDNGTYTNFVNDSAGYGIAQWTYWTLKRDMLDFHKKKNKSIGDGQTQMEFLAHQLSTSYKAVWNTLLNAKTIREASDAVLLKFERPADQSEAVQKKRAEYGKVYYDKYASKTTVTAPKEEPKKPAAAPVSPYKVGEIVKLTDNATYASGIKIPDWVKNSTIYVREIYTNGNIVFSTQKTGAVTGVTKPEFILKANQTETKPQTKDPNVLNVGDVVYLAPDATFSNGQKIQSWVFKNKLYVRQIRANGDVIISTVQTGAITGVVNKKFLTKEFIPAEVKVQVTASSLRLREGPGTNYKTVDHLNKYTTVVIKEIKNGWGKTDKGWLLLEYTKKV